MLKVFEQLFHIMIAKALFRIHRTSSLCIFDLDNTLVKTREFQIFHGATNIFDNREFPQMTDAALALLKKKQLSEKILILTARPYSYTFSTHKYVKKHGINCPVIVCRTATMKLLYLKEFSKRIEHLSYYDDLTHGTLKIEFYSVLIEEVMNLNCTYFDNNYIKKNILQ